MPQYRNVTNESLSLDLSLAADGSELVRVRPGAVVDIPQHYLDVRTLQTSDVTPNPLWAPVRAAKRPTK